MREAGNGTAGPMQLVENFARLDRHAASLYRRFWAEGYPSVELVDDLENRGVYSLLCASCQLRYIVSRLADVLGSDAGNRDGKVMQIRAVGKAIDDVGVQFADILKVAVRLEGDIGHERRLVANIRWIVPYYYAVKLEFYRVVAIAAETGSVTEEAGSGAPIEATPGYINLTPAQRTALHQIMTLAWQAYSHEGNAAVARMGHPLLMVALETDDPIHRQWILERYKQLERQGRKWIVAGELVKEIVKGQKTGKKNEWD